MHLADKALLCLGWNESDGSFKQIIDGYNNMDSLPRSYKMKYTDEWCMAFVSYCAYSTRASETVFPYECSCGRAIEKLIQQGLWVEDDNYVPKSNDLIFYHWGDNGSDDCTHWPNHVGIVVQISENGISVVEGNYNSCVKMRNVPLNWQYIRGFGNTSTLYTNVAIIDYTTLAYQIIAGKYGNGDERINALRQAGYDPERAQLYVNMIYANNVSDYNRKDLDEVAKEVIRGEWGNNPVRANRLLKAGYDPEAIQEIVNDYYRKEVTK